MLYGWEFCFIWEDCSHVVFVLRPKEDALNSQETALAVIIYLVFSLHVYNIYIVTYVYIYYAINITYDVNKAVATIKDRRKELDELLV